MAIRSHRPPSAPARTVLLTLLLGATVVVSWLGIRGLGVFNGPGPWLQETWFLIWAVQALLAFGLVFAAEWLRPSASRRAMVTTVLAAWIGELVVVAVMTAFLIGELEVWHAPFVWLVATGAVIQPAAAILGGQLRATWR